MFPGPRRLWLAGLLSVWLTATAAAPAQMPAPGQVLALAVAGGRCDCVIPTPNPDEKYCLVVASASRGAGPFPVQVRTQATALAPVLPLESVRSDEDWFRRTQEWHERQVRARQLFPGPSEPQAVADPPRQRIFHLFIKGQDFQDADNYVAVHSDLHTVGRHCQVYVERGCPVLERLGPTIADTVHTFDDDVYPRARQWLGEALDVDRDGRFTILFTGWLSKMADGRSALGGFVRCSDFYRDLAPPFGNRCDMMYLNTDLQPGPRLRTILAHEYTHAIVSSEHLFGHYLPDVPRQDEENWLNEALAHVAEEWHGYGWSNLDYRISAFLSAPERYQLVVPDYHRAGIWRSHGHRGATYLFLRWCAGRHGPELVNQLIRSNLAGVANLEAATRQPFADLLRRWTVDLACSSFSRDPKGDVKFPLPFGSRLNGPLEGRLLAGPRFRSLTLADGADQINLPGTSAAYFLLHSPLGGSSRLMIVTEPEAQLQVSLIRLPEKTGRLSVRCQAIDNGCVQLALTAHDADLTLQAAAWERLVPLANRAEDTSHRPGAAPEATVRTWFGDASVKAGETRFTAPIPLPRWQDANRSLIFKVLATDPRRNHVTGWLEMDRND